MLLAAQPQLDVYAGRGRPPRFCPRRSVCLDCLGDYLSRLAECALPVERERRLER